MVRALLFVGLLCVAAFGAVWLADHPGTVTVVWQGREVETSLAVGLVFVAAVAVAFAVLWAAIRFLVRLPHRVGRNSAVRRRERGHAALSRGIVAIGAGDLVSARRHAAEAERLAGHEPLTLLLRAQTAQAGGDRVASEAAFRRMLENRDTRVLGLRGLFLEARRRGDADAARASAEQALKTAPAAGWANDALLEAHSADGQWGAALRAVERRASLGIADRGETRRQRAVLHAADALAKDEHGDPDAALAAAQEAVRLAPDLVPGVVVAARLLSRRGDLKKAARIVETAWRRAPHPDLAGAYLNLRPGDSAADRLARADTLARLSSWAPEARLAIARTGIEARQLDRARDALKPLLDDRPTVRTCLMAAELEQAEGRTGGTREWLARAARAPHDKAWVADGVVSDHWAPVSPVSGRLDAFEWRVPPDALGRTHFEEHGFLDLAMRAAEPAAAEAPALPASPPAASDRSPVAEPPAAPAEPRSKPAAATAPAPTQLAADIADRRDKAAAAVEGAALRSEPVPVRASRPRPPPVVFPVAHPPDDPGPDGAEEKASAFGPRR